MPATNKKGMSATIGDSAPDVSAMPIKPADHAELWQLDAKWEYRWRGESSKVFEAWWVVNGSKVLVERSVNEKMNEK
jgi:hypothetical protein